MYAESFDTKSLSSPNSRTSYIYPDAESTSRALTFNRIGKEYQEEYVSSYFNAKGKRVTTKFPTKHWIWIDSWNVYLSSRSARGNRLIGVIEKISDGEWNSSDGGSYPSWEEASIGLYEGWIAERRTSRVTAIVE